MIYTPLTLTTILESPLQNPADEGTLGSLSGGNQYFQHGHSRSQSQTSNGGLSPGPYAPQPSVSPPPASNIRRHTSLTANAAAGAAGRRRLAQRAAERAAQSPSPPSPTGAENDHLRSPLSPIGRTPWGPATPPIGSSNKEWSVDEVQRQLGNMELAPPSQNLEVSTSPIPRRLSPGPNHPPRFRANSPQPGVPQQNQQQPGPQPGFNGGGGGRPMAKLQLITDLSPPAVPPKQPQSAAASVPPIGHGIPQVRRWNGRPVEQSGYRDNGNGGQRQDEKPFTASGVVWDQKDRIIGTRSGGNGFDASGAPPVPPIPQAYAGMMQPGMNFGGMNMGGLDATSFARLGMNMGMMSPGNIGNMNPGFGGQGRLQVNTAVTGSGQGLSSTSAVGSGNGGTSPSGYLSPVDVPSLIVSKGYNPANFDIRPQFVSTELPGSSCVGLQDLITGALLCYQIIYRGRRPQIPQVRDLELNRPW
jgi:hypothetical protein